MVIVVVVIVEVVVVIVVTAAAVIVVAAPAAFTAAAAVVVVAVVVVVQRLKIQIACLKISHHSVLLLFALVHKYRNYAGLIFKKTHKANSC